MPNDRRCRCGSGDDYAVCCGPFHAGERAAPTAVAQMRSRFSAFAIGDGDYLLATWYPETSPKLLNLDPAISWRRLEIVNVVAGAEQDAEGLVEFRAHYRCDGRRQILHERSRFVRINGRWMYVDGDVIT
jgi:SEC-C motif-containing protein